MKTTDFKIRATVAAGLESLVGKELKDLGIEYRMENGYAEFFGDFETIAQCNIWLRTADRLKIVVGEFKAFEWDELFEKVKAIPWEDYLSADANFPVAGRSIKSKLFSTPDAQRLTKKAIVDRLRAAYKLPEYRPLRENGPKYSLEVALLKDTVSLLLDTTGPSLFKRGYRVEKGGAPLKENMAAALVMLTNWRNDLPFYDPTCGSGTIAIEAAMIGLGMAPGNMRDFDFEFWTQVPKGLVDGVRAEADDKVDYDAKLDILACDIDHKLVEIAKENAQNAGVADSIEFKQMRAEDFTTDKEVGVILSNPPYGERLNEVDYVHKLYRGMGNVYKQLPYWSKYILASDEDFEHYYGAKATKKRKLYNGAMRVDLYQYWGQRKPRD
ncbi:MAG: class I SAM-dependent RNA methyltransferase [Lactobacillales bacterium]|jgi:putative N6-adenine-specific DNA methylase|nr:class I SAM-dependent RNA methyltransferase [Lactobacillales bacterium]